MTKTASTIDSTCKNLRPLAEYCERVPSARKNKRIHRATIWRWALHGIRGATLRTVVLGGSRYTCDAWVASFMEELGRKRSPPRRGSAPPLAEPRRREIEERFRVHRNSKTPSLRARRSRNASSEGAGDE